MRNDMSQPHTRVYRKGVLEAEGFPIADISEYLDQPDVVVWADFCGPSKVELHELAGELGLHELAVEDALSEHQRPKLDRYTTHQFLSCHAVRVNAGAGRLEVTEVDVFFSDRWLVTVRKDEGFPLDPVIQRWDRSPDLAALGVAYFIYGLLDVVVDGYFDAVQVFDEYYDTVSESLFVDKPLEPQQQRHWFEMRRALVKFRRLVVPLREAVSTLMRRESGTLHDEVYPYYQDVYDHLLRAVESTDALRDLVATIVDTNLSLRDYRQNQIVKKVTSWAAIIAVPTLITGYYGMNVPYPGFNRTSGVIVSSFLIVAISTALYLLFRRREWL
jgi:magnesium transporter